jgi:hypothetical protein
MTTNFIRTIAAAVLIATTSTSTLADIRIRFAKGRTSATVTGKVAKGGRICYIAGARRGQLITATVSSNTGRVQIFESGETAYSYQIEVSGDQSICVDNLGRAATYRLTVSIR